MSKLTNERVLRFGKVAIFTHWAHTVTFLLLALTGMLIFFNFLDFLIPLFGGMQGVRIVHRVMAILFVIFPVISLIANPKGFAMWMKEVTTWGKDELGFFQGFVKEMLGMHAEVPPQGRFNAGEKLNSIFQVLGCALLAFTGFIIWFPQYFSRGFVQLMLPLHDLAFILTFTALLGHIYLATMHPHSKEAINGMKSGYVDAGFAESHYPKWYAQIKKGKA